MQFRPGQPSDFAHLETFVWQAIFPAFDREGLDEEQRRENDVLVEQARPAALAALEDEQQAVFTAWDDRRRALAGYLLLDLSTGDYATITALIVRRADWGKGVGDGLLRIAQDHAGPYRGLQIALRYYNARAQAFFGKQQFENTGEAAGDYHIERILWIREAPSRPEPVLADTEAVPELDLLPLVSADPPSEGDDVVEDDFSTETDAPYFAPLPDYTLAADHPDEPLFPPEETTLDRQQRATLDDFIARAKARKSGKAVPKPPGPNTDLFSAMIVPEPELEAVDVPPAERPDEVPATDALTRHPEIELEIDYGPATPPSDAAADDGPTPTAGPSFEFAFAADPKEAADFSEPDSPPASALDFEFAFGPPPPEAATEEPSPATPPPPARHCPNCLAAVSPDAFFCPNCGNRLEQEADVLTLEDLPTQDTDTEVANEETVAKELTVSEVRQSFEDKLGERLTAYFGADRLPDYLAVYQSDDLFRQIRDVSLKTLTGYLNRELNPGKARRRREVVLSGLVEYFVVESAGDLHQQHFPQRLLRYQGVDWKQVDLFKLVMDYLDLDRETETVYTDFLTTPAKVLRNATKHYLKASRDERVLLICDQSLLGSGKHGFAFTDSALYWKNILQPAGSATYTTTQRVRSEKGHLSIDGQYFDAGSALNLRIALLLDKLRLLDLRDE